VARNVKLVGFMVGGKKKMVNISDSQGRCTYRYRVAVLDSDCEDVEVGVCVPLPPSVRVVVGLLVDMADGEQRAELDDGDDDKGRQVKGRIT